METIEIIQRNDKKLLDELAIKLIRRYHSGWELDEYIWVLKDGRIFTTDNNRVCVFTEEDLKEYIEEMENNLIKIKDIN